MLAVREAFDWLKPSPLWVGGIGEARQADFFQPQVLEFDNDDFIGAFRTAATATDTSGFRAAVRMPTAENPLKLYQPAHGRFYLVAAALSCRQHGFPERTIDFGEKESVFFVIRKFVDGAEFGWVVTDTTKNTGQTKNTGTTKGWQPVGGDARRLLADEQRLPLSQAVGSDGRMILVGYIPAASGDVYSVSASALNAAAAPGEFDPSQFPHGIDLRIEQLEGRFSTPLSKTTEIQRQPALISVYLLLDLLDFFESYLPAVAAALETPNAPGNPPLSAAERQLLGVLAAQTVGGGPNLANALNAVAAQRAQLDAPDGADPAALGFGSYDLTAGSLNIKSLEEAVFNALPPDDTAIELPRQGASTDETYAIRCVYERPQCSPPLQVVSQRSVFFSLATFFDADAPARPVRIVMPTDVSLAGIRKFSRNVNFLISPSLQKKINIITGHERDLLQPSPPPLGSDANGLGWMCSFSFQIIFIVAFFLLLMFVIILNIAFWWIAFFKICIPIPKKLLAGSKSLLSGSS
jgi:hypothetical protein